MNPTSYRGDFGILDSWLTDETLAYGGSNRWYPHEVGLRRLIHTRVGGFCRLGAASSRQRREFCQSTKV